VRQQVNQSIRSSGEFDAVVDFDLALRDPPQPARMLPAYDSGEHLHPGGRGVQAMAEAVPLALPRRRYHSRRAWQCAARGRPEQSAQFFMP